jgi:hypothetical protein
LMSCCVPALFSGGDECTPGERAARIKGEILSHQN